MQQGKQLISGGGVPGSSTTVSDEINTSSNIVGPLHWLLYTYQQFIKSGVFETGNTQLVGKNGSFSKEKSKKKSLDYLEMILPGHVCLDLLTKK